MEDIAYIGKIIRLMIENQNRNRQTHLKEIRLVASTNKPKTYDLIEESNAYLHNFGMEIAPSDSTLSKADRFFIRKSKANKDDPGPLTDDNRRLYMLFALIGSENDSLSSVESLREMDIFSNVNVDDFLKQAKSEGYVATRREENREVYSLGWRYNVEFREIFDVADFFELKL